MSQINNATEWAEFVVSEWVKRNQIDLASDKQKDLVRLIKASILHFQLGNLPGKFNHPATKALTELLSDNR